MVSPARTAEGPVRDAEPETADTVKTFRQRAVAMTKAVIKDINFFISASPLLVWIYRAFFKNECLDLDKVGYGNGAFTACVRTQKGSF